MNNVEITNCNSYVKRDVCFICYAEFGCIRHCDKTVSQTSLTAQ